MASEADAPATAAAHDNNLMPRAPVSALIRHTAVNKEDGPAIGLESLPATNSQHPDLHETDGSAQEMEPPPATNQQAHPAHKQDGSAPEAESPPARNQKIPPAQRRDGNEDNRDLVEEYFMGSNSPYIALFAITICLVGVMDLLPQPRHDPNTWTDKLESVNSYYGPGTVISWCICGMSMLYDANQDAKEGAIHWLKYATLILTGVIAAVDAVKRALQSDFGPSYAAALYMSDKSFELATLLYTVYNFPVYRDGSAAREAHRDVPEAEQPKSKFQAKAAAAIKRYRMWPCVAMVSIWLWSRALANQHAVYNIHAQNPKGVNVGWDPVLSSRYWKLAVPVVCFGLTSTFSAMMRWGLWSWGVPMGILSSFATLHSGFFGTFTPLKLTSCSILDLDQIAALVITIVVLFLQYTSETWKALRRKLLRRSEN